MNIDIISVLPELMESPLNHSILKRAREKQLINITFHNLREYTEDKHRQVDDYQFGGGSGMVMKVEPIANCIRALKKKRSYDEIIFMTPDGKKFTQKEANTLSLKKNLLILAGHYKGIDQRIRDLFITSEISIGDFVLTGGELPSLILVDAIARLIPGVVNSESSVLNDSFQDNLLSPPLYTRPQCFENLEVPDVLLSGNQKKIDKWRLEKSIEKTKKNRPDLLSD